MPHFRASPWLAMALAGALASACGSSSSSDKKAVAPCVKGSGPSTLTFAGCTYSSAPIIDFNTLTGFPDPLVWGALTSTDWPQDAFVEFDSGLSAGGSFDTFAAIQWANPPAAMAATYSLTFGNLVDNTGSVVFQAGTNFCFSAAGSVTVTAFPAAPGSSSITGSVIVSQWLFNPGSVCPAVPATGSFSVARAVDNTYGNNLQGSDTFFVMRTGGTGVPPSNTYTERDLRHCAITSLVLRDVPLQQLAHASDHAGLLMQRRYTNLSRANMLKPPAERYDPVARVILPEVRVGPLSIYVTKVPEPVRTVALSH